MGMAWKRVSLLGLVAAVLCIWALFFRGALFGTGPVTIGVQVAAVGLMIWARITFGLRSFHAAANPTSGRLVTNGPYRFVRHPIYAAVLYFVWAGVAAHPSMMHAIIGLGVTAGFAVRMVAEERLVVGKYPEYADYARRTRRVIPFVF